jgi:hypothetical protein
VLELDKVLKDQIHILRSDADSGIGHEEPDLVGPPKLDQDRPDWRPGLSISSSSTLPLLLAAFKASMNSRDLRATSCVSAADILFDDVCP